MKKTIFKGVATALITPLDERGVCYDELGRLIDWQIESGINALVIAGTTGEASTLTDDEHREVIEYSVKRAAGRVPIIAGTGSNDTAYALDLTRCACEAGADAMLVVTPYYNKATQSGLIKMFTQIADASTKPVILYNVPSRTGCNITLPVYKELAKHERIVAVKEASGNMSAIAELIAECGDSLDVYSGNDDQIVPIMSLGGKGVISVLSNVMPRETHDMVRLCLEGNYAEAAKLQLTLLDLINALFCEVNPVPVKTAMAEMGLCDIEMRLPLCEMEDNTKARLVGALKKHGLL